MLAGPYRPGLVLGIERRVGPHGRVLDARKVLLEGCLGCDGLPVGFLEWSAKDLRASTIDWLAAIYGLTAVEFLAVKLPQTEVQPPAPTAPHKPRRRSAKPKGGAPL